MYSYHFNHHYTLWDPYCTIEIIAIFDWNFIIQKLLKNDSTSALNYQNYMLNSLVKLTSKYLHKYKHIYSE